MNPYIEKTWKNYKIRTFSVAVNEQELVWHRDKRSRIVRVIEGKGWKIQLDNQLPRTFYEGDIINISKMRYHRLIKGHTDLVLEIKEQWVDIEKQWEKP